MTVWSADTGTAQFVLSFFAQPGDTVKLAPGTYSGLTFMNQAFGGVTITSADPSHAALLTPFSITGSSGLTFSNIELYANGPVGTWEYVVQNSSDIHFDHISGHGSLDGDASNDPFGLLFQNVDNISITNSEFQQLTKTAQVLVGSNIVFANNTIHDMRSDGFNFAQVDHVTISGNSFTNFRPVNGDHPDAIQFWTTNTTASSHDILITGNVIDIGDGARVQGVFMGNSDPTLPFLNVTISNNVLYGTLINGIAVYNGHGVTLTGNELLSLPGKANFTMVELHNSDGVTLVGNDAPKFIFDHITNLSETSDTLNLGTDDFGVAAMHAYGLLHPDMASILQPFIDAHPLAVVAPLPDVTPVTPVTPVITTPVTPSVPSVPNVPFVFVPMPMLGPGDIML